MWPRVADDVGTDPPGDPTTSIRFTKEVATGHQVRFRVEAPVTRRSPHRSGREDFPHLMCYNT
jgi:hypothetical protein